MERYIKSAEELKKIYSFDEDFELIGHFAAGQIPVFICSKDFLILERHAGFENYTVYDFDDSEVTDIDFYDFAVKWAKGFIKTFVTFKENKEQKAQILSDQILEFVLYGSYGEKKYFSSENISMYIAIVPGGYLCDMGNTVVFVPFDSVVKETETKLALAMYEKQSEEV